MQLKIKNIDINELECARSLAFTAVLLVNDQVVALVRDKGVGEGIEILPLRKSDAQIIAEASRFCALHYTLQVTYAWELGSVYTQQSALAHFIEHQVCQLVQSRMMWQEQPELAMMMESAILYGGIDGPLYCHQLSTPIEELLSSKKGCQILEIALRGIVPYLSSGERILNQNIPFFLLQILLQ
ncbi:hypothetical protein [Chitinophaga sp. S165]|uniref:hypothetical protein n=1 Tax=Chitinophaga sp. S165 TaxID=2135462 RepID=UPI000D71243E|nr:hypothetical protein [Chitinophaga sp. S165]PWV47109.1 hypothetical protein C7475_109197 [Chitinophaga sp. S165]